MNKNIIALAASLGAMGVILGAFGAHAIKPLISESSYVTFSTGIQYHFYHTFAIFVAAILLRDLKCKKTLLQAAWCFFVGILLFSGSLYLLATSSLLGIDSFRKILGPITPIGGIAFISGWVLLFFAAIKEHSK